MIFEPRTLDAIKILDWRQKFVLNNKKDREYINL